jgi:hypothetical protein
MVLIRLHWHILRLHIIARALINHYRSWLVVYGPLAVIDLIFVTMVMM